MKNTQQGFIGIALALLVVIGIGVVGGGVYYKTKINPNFLSDNKTQVSGTANADVDVSPMASTTTPPPGLLRVKETPKANTSVQAMAPSVPEVKVAATVSTPAPVVATNACSTMNCFTDAYKACTSAQFTNTFSGEIFGSNISTNMTLNTVVKGNTCGLGIKLNSYTASPGTDLRASVGTNTINTMNTDGTISKDNLTLDQSYAQTNARAKQNVVGKAGVCEIADKDKSSVIEGLLAGKAYMFLLGSDGCSGPLFDSIKAMSTF
ncbi:MAG: hypothetical protein V4576_04000 [Patescibacteria group bacterium]